MLQWSIIFWFSSGVYVLGAVVFLFVNAEPEKWATANADQMEANKTKEAVDPAEAPNLSRMRSRTYSLIG